MVNQNDIICIITPVSVDTDHSINVRMRSVKHKTEQTNKFIRQLLVIQIDVKIPYVLACFPMINLVLFMIPPLLLLSFCWLPPPPNRMPAMIYDPL